MATAVVFIVLLALFTAALFWLVPRLSNAASSTSNKVQSSLTQLYVATGEMKEIASLYSGSAVRLKVKGASVRVRREGAGEKIVISANYPINWRNNEGTIEQVETTDSNKAASASTLKLVKVLSLSREPVAPSRVQISGSDILVDGKKANVMFSGDELEVLVPEAHRGDIIIFNEGSDEIHIERWVGGKVELTSTGSADFTGGELTELAAFRASMSGSGAVTFDRIAGAEVEVSLCDGNFEVPSVTATQTYKLTVTGSGDVTMSDALHVEEGVIELPVDSYSNLTVGAVSCKNLSIYSAGQGNCEFDSVSGGKLKAAFANSSAFTVHNRISVETFDFACEGSGDLSCEDIYATASATIKTTADSYCNVSASTIDAPRVEIESAGKGNVDVYDIRSDTFVGAFDSDSYFTVENRLRGGNTTLEMRSVGDASIGELSATEASVTSRSNSNVTISNLQSDNTSLTNEGTGTIDVEDGRGARLVLTTHNGGDITICGDFSSVTTNKSGSGTITI